MLEFECKHCGEVNEIDLSDSNLSELVGKSVETDKEVMDLREELKEKNILLGRRNAELEKARSGITSAISKTERPSVEIQGEVAEELLFDDVKNAFDEDEFHPIKKGKIGAIIEARMNSTRLNMFHHTNNIYIFSITNSIRFSFNCFI